MKKLTNYLFFVLLSISVNAQNTNVKNVPFTNIGPAIMSGRVVDVDVNPNQPTEFYVAYASGGLWYTNNNGTTFKPVMDNASTQNIGDIAVDWKNKTIWVGTGENNSSRSSYAGIGILKSTDLGKTWINVGLKDSHHVSRILINPKNPDEVVIGIIGHLYTPNTQRGVFKTTDGGKTWNKTLFIDENTGVIDVAVSPQNFNTMYASAWERNRKAWNFDGDGPNSGIYKSTDAGKTWIKITDKKSGFPIGDGIGRIGLAIFNDNIAYAVLDNQFRREKSKEKNIDEGLKKEDFKTMSSEIFLALDNKKLNKFLKANGFQEKYRAESVKNLIKKGKVKPIDVAHYLEDANSQLFDTPVIGTEVYKTIDGGKTWQKTHNDYLDDIYYSYGYYFGQIQVDVNNENNIYISGVPILKSKDGGKSFVSIQKENVHADHHSLWLNPNLKGHLINGNDGGLNISYDDGESWIKCNQPAVGQFYAVNVDNVTPYNVYGGLQDNGVWKGPSSYKASDSWHQSGEYPYKSIMGGDGMHVQIDNRNNQLIYTGFQFGNYYRIDLEKDKNKYIQPKHELGETPLRFNWQTPILLSSHNQDILYFGSNKLHRSMNKGDDFETISGDLTKGGKKGNVAYGTLTSISESPLQFGLIYVGSDDGLVYVTKNGGDKWVKISDTFPQDLWVSRVIASQHQKERVFVTLNGYRNDDFKAYVYVSDDYGSTWENISTNLSESPINVIKEDVKDENLLFVGTDNGVYSSFNKGNTWNAFENGIPKVAVHDLVIHPTSNDLIIATHGRSIYKTNIAPLQQYLTTKDKEVVIFDVEEVTHSKNWGSTWSKWMKPYEPTIQIPFYVSKSQKVNLKIRSDKGIEMNSFEVDSQKGFNYFEYDLTMTEKAKKQFEKQNTGITIKEAKNEKRYLPKGVYTIQIGKVKKELTII